MTMIHQAFEGFLYKSAKTAETLNRTKLRAHLIKH